MEPNSVLTALSLVEKTAKAINSARERAKTSKDTALKEIISDLYDDFLDLKAIVLRLTEENAELRRELSEQDQKPQKPEIRQVGETNYYFVGDQGPYCQPCYDGSGKLVPLMPRHNYVGGPGRKCEVCEKVFFEANEPAQRMHIKPYTG